MISVRRTGHFGGVPKTWEALMKSGSMKGTATTSSRLCNTACRTVPGPFVLTGPEVLGMVDSKHMQRNQSVVVADQTTTRPDPASQIRARYTQSQPIRTTSRSSCRSRQLAVPLRICNPSLCDKTSLGITVIGAPSATGHCIVVFQRPLNNDALSRVAKERGMECGSGLS